MRDWLARLSEFFAGVDERVEQDARRQAQEDVDRARRAEREFLAGSNRGGDFEQRDTLPGSPRAHLYDRWR